MMMLFVRYVGRRGCVLDVQRTVRYRTDTSTFDYIDSFFKKYYTIIIDTSIYINLHTYYILLAQFMGYVSQMIYVKTEKTIFICWNYYFFILCNKNIHSYGTVQVRYSTLHFCDVENVIRYKYLRIRYTKFFLHFCNIMIIVILHFFKYIF